MLRLPLSGRLLLGLVLLSACGRQQTLRGLFQAASAHEEYAHRLQQAKLHETALGRDWLAAADRALRDSLVVPLPFQETGYFRADQASAAAYRYAVRAGEQINVRLTLAPGTEARVFVDAFELRPPAPPRRLAAADTAALSFSYVADEDRQHLLRVQPELLRTGRYTLSIRRTPSLGFPVQGKTDAAAASFWGAARDNGARLHEGIDIFARRGTPVVAAAAGVVTRTGETPRGGKVVWLADAEHGQHLYYAHLDQQLVQPGQVVKAGDVLGLVGNTGNARTTAPHLHFGVYRGGRGALDPLPFVRRADALPPGAPPPMAQLGQWVRTTRPDTWLGSSPAGHSRLAKLPAATPLFVVGGQPGWLRVARPDGRLGYVAARQVQPAAPLRRELLTGGAELFAQPRPGAPALDSLPARSRVAVLGQYGRFRLVQTTGGRVGWLSPPAGRG